MGARVVQRGGRQVWKGHLYLPRPGPLSRLVINAPYGSTAAADTLPVTQPARPSLPVERPTEIDFHNGTGKTLSIGDVVCRRVTPAGGRTGDIASAHNRYDPLGVVTEYSVPNDEPGWVANNGVVNALVLGDATLIAGSILDVVPGQVYLQGTLTVFGTVFFAHFIIMENHLAASTKLCRVRVKCAI